MTQSLQIDTQSMEKAGEESK